MAAKSDVGRGQINPRTLEAVACVRDTGCTIYAAAKRFQVPYSSVQQRLKYELRSFEREAEKERKEKERQAEKDRKELERKVERDRRDAIKASRFMVKRRVIKQLRDEYTSDPSIEYTEGIDN